MSNCRYCRLNAQGQQKHYMTYDARIGLIQDWLAQCESHPECCYPETLPSLPSRVLDLNLGDNTEDVRIVDGVGLTGRYAALTYRWGPPDAIYKTTTANLEDHRSRIKLSDLNALFRESIMVLRSLQIPYFWVDALCIMQGDDDAAIDDWATEASRMGTVYSNAYLTVSAATAQTPDETLITHLTPRPRRFGHDRYSDNTILTEVAWGTLSTRGWCFQERVLSRRIVHFGHQQMYWECGGASRNEHYMEKFFDGYPDRSNTLHDAFRLVQGRDGFLTYRSDPSRPDHDHTTVQPYDRWYAAMKDYSGRSFTKPSDRAPAMLGLVNTFAQATNDTMAHGLWLRDLALGLIWKVDASGEEEAAHGTASPSWSWLGMGRKVLWPAILGTTTRDHVSIFDICFDEVTMSIILQGKLFRYLPESNRKEEEPLQNGLYWNMCWDVASDEALLRKVWVLVVVDSPLPNDAYGLLLMETDSSGSYQRVGCMQLSCFSRDPGRVERIRTDDLPYQTITLR